MLAVLNSIKSTWHMRPHRGRLEFTWGRLEFLPLAKGGCSKGAWFTLSPKNVVAERGLTNALW